MDLYSTESLLIGCALNTGNPDTLGDVDFVEHPVIAAAIREGAPCDPETVYARLRGNPNAAAAYGSSLGPTIYTLYERAPGGDATANAWRTILKDERRRERLMALGQRLFQAAADESIPNEDLIAVAVTVQADLEGLL